MIGILFKIFKVKWRRNNCLTSRMTKTTKGFARKFLFGCENWCCEADRNSYLLFCIWLLCGEFCMAFKHIGALWTKYWSLLCKWPWLIIIETRSTISDKRVGAKIDISDFYLFAHHYLQALQSWTQWYFIASIVLGLLALRKKCKNNYSFLVTRLISWSIVYKYSGNHLALVREKAMGNCSSFITSWANACRKRTWKQ